jgi:bifunctional non-homologous end joining protein LigD
LPAFVDAYIDLPAWSVIVDGELCFIGGNGQADFHRLMAEMRTKWPDQDQLVLIMFDLLHQDGVDLRPLPLTERKRDLVRLCRKSVLSRMKLIQTFPEGQVLFVHCASYGFEGIVAKRLDRPYVSGPSRSWVKVKCPGWKRENSERFRMFEGSWWR